MTSTVPVHVPFVSEDGSAETSSVTPSGGTMPLVGVTASHGLSTVATNERELFSKPGTKSWKVTGRWLPFGTLTFAPLPSNTGTGRTTMLIGVENGPSP